jgi:hypothetical protein
MQIGIRDGEGLGEGRGAVAGSPGKKERRWLVAGAAVKKKIRTSPAPSFHFIAFTYTDAHATTSSHINHHARATNISGIPGHVHVNSQEAEEQPHRVSTWDLDSSHRGAVRTACSKQ